MALLLILLMLVVQSPDLLAASASDLGPDYDWSPTLIATNPPHNRPKDKDQVNQVEQALPSVQSYPPEDKLQIIYGLPTREDSVLAIQNPYHDKTEQQQQLHYHDDTSQHLQQHHHDDTVQQQQHLYEPQHEDHPQSHNYAIDTYYSSHYAANEIQTEPGRPSRPLIKQQISDKTWNVAAPYIKPADNLIEDVSFNIGIILVVFTVFVLSLGAIAGALTTKRTGGRSLAVSDLADLAQGVLGGIQMLENQFTE